MSGEINFGRVLDPLLQLVRSMITPRLDMLAFYPATVVAQNGMNVDVSPDNQALLGPGFQNLPIYTGEPNDTFVLDLSTHPRVLIGFGEGNPQKPFVAAWLAGALTSRQINAGTINLGNATDAVLLGTTYRTQEYAWHTALQTWHTALISAFTGMNPSNLPAKASNIVSATLTMAIALSAYEPSPTAYLSTTVNTQ